MADNQTPGFDDAVASVLHQDAAGTAAAIRNNMQFSVDANPDQEAKYRQLSSTTGVPLPSVRAQPDAAKQQAAVVNVNADQLALQTPHLAQFLTNMDNTRLIHDDVPGTANVEGAVKAVTGTAAPQLDEQVTAYEPSIGQRVRAWLDDAFGLTQRENARAWVQYASQRAGITPAQARDVFGGASEIPTQVASKLVNAASFGIVPDMEGTPVTTGGAVGGAAGMLAGFLIGPVAGAEKLADLVGMHALDHVAGESFAKALAKDVTAQSLKLGTAGALGQVGTAIDSPDLTTALQKESKAFVVNAATGGVFGAAGRLIPDPGLLSTVARMAGIQSSLDLMSGKTPFEDVANWDHLTPVEKGDAAFNIMLNGAFGMRGAGRTQGGWFQDAAKADLAGEDMSKLQMLSSASTASKLRERDPTAFKQFVDDVTEDGNLQNVYVDAKTLVDVFNQSGVKADDLQRLMPDVAAQLQEATQTQGDVRISVPDYTTHLAGTPADEALLPNLKTTPDGMTYAQGQEFQKTQVETLKAEAEKITQEQATNGVYLADRQQVYDNILGQLDTANRFPPEVNKAYAALTRDFYATTADRMGVTPGELLAQHPLNIAVERMPGEGLDQAGGDRGAYDPETSTLALLKNADLTTFLHESGHHFLEMTADLAGQHDAPAGVRGDFDQLLNWFGVKDAATWRGMSLEEKRSYHEQFARGFESYLMEGKAPSVEQTGMFARFRSWLINVYKSFSSLKVNLTPEVRGVMGRMLASDEAIKQAEQVRGYEPLFKSAEQAGMTPEEYASYQMTGAEATTDAVQALQDKSLRDMKWLSNAKSRALKASQREADSARKAIKDQAAQEVNAMPVYQAKRYIKEQRATEPEALAARKAWDQKRTAEAATTLAAVKAEKWDQSDEAKAGKKGLEKGQFFAKNKRAIDNEVERRVLEWERSNPRPSLPAAKLDMDLVADRFGFGSGAELADAIEGAQKAKDMIEGLTDQRMLEQHGELSTPEGIQRAAEAAIHNEARARFVATELRALAKAQGPARAIAEAAKQAAEGAIAAKRVRDVSVGQYTVAEAKAARNADKALIAGDVTMAANEKRAQLLNNRLARAASDALSEVSKAVDYFKKFDKGTVRDKIELEYREQIDALLDQYDLRTSTSGKELDRRQSLRDWYAEQQDKGYNPAIPDYLMDNMSATHYKDLTIEQLRGLRDGVEAIEHLGRLKQTLLDGKDMREFTAVVDEATAAMDKLPQRTPESNRGLTRINEKWLGTKSFVRSMDASLLKMEQVFDWLDKHDSTGVFNRVVFRRIADAGVKENDLRTGITSKLKALAEAMPKDAQRDLLRIIPTPELLDSKTGEPGRLTKGEILAMAMNYGNDSNLVKMAKGEKWSPDAIKQVLDRTMTKPDWDFVQGVWDAIESLYPEIEALERRLGNSAPEKIVPRAFATPHGEYRGGYYPAVYDPLRSYDAEQNRQRGADKLFENNYTRATTPKGHTIARAENYARPILLDLDVLPRHLTQVIHDVAYREAVIDADRFLSNSAIRAGIENTLGREIYTQLRPWLQGIANDKTFDNKGMSFWNQAAHWARTNATIVGLGYRVTTMMIHGTTAASNSVGEIGVKWFASGANAFLGSVEKMTAARDFVFERSGEMRNRMNETDRDVRDALREMELKAASGAERMLDPVRRFAYYGISMLDMASAMPTWMGAYNKGLFENMTEQDAIYYADKAVRNAHGGGGVKDSAAFQRGEEFQKLFGMFYSFWNHFYNRQRDIARTASQIPGQLREGDYAGARRDFAMVLARSWFYFVIPQLLHAALKPPANPDQEQEHQNWAAWAAEEIALGLFSGIPVVRDLASSAATGRDYQATPAVGIVQNVAKSAQDIEHAAKGEPVSDKWLKHAVTNAGYVFGLPTGQPANAAQFVWDLSTDKTHPQGMADWYAGIVHGDIHKH